ncbi:hypothetical protein BDQ17DRAFT_1360101 [Cyathus striatus]|nr:hypothetical protein BDQ17DRAFT_1360101 [Cyathus striatus]
MALHWNLWSTLQWNYSPSVLDVPSFVSLISIIVLASAFSSRSALGDLSRDESYEGQHTFLSCLRFNFKCEEYAITRYEIIRVLGVTSLLALSLVSFFEKQDVQNAAAVITYCYCFLLSAAFFVNTGLSTRSSLTNHLSTMLGTMFLIYVYHDLHYLATYNESPVHDSRHTWTRIALLSLVGGGIPMFIPGRYVPVDGKDPHTPPPDQTASVFSLLTYSFLNHIVWLGYRAPHISLEDLPPLADYNHAKVIMKKAFHHLDPDDITNRRHVFFNLLRAFKWQLSLLSVPLLTQTVSNFSFPLAINNLLETLKPSREQATIHPWVWVALLFVGPMASAFSLEMYFYYSKRLVIQVEALLTQVMFERVLKMPLDSGGLTNTSNNVGDSIAPTSEPEARQGIKSEAHNMVGKISSLVTTDMTNIGNAIDFVCLLVYIPPHIIIGVWFLYSILGWSSVVGLSVLVAFLALPTYIAKISQGVESVRMKNTDARVQAVSEALNLARMVKLFGWEGKMEKTLGRRREDELRWIEKREILGIGRKLSNTIITVSTMLTTYVTSVFKKELSAAAVFSSAAVFSTLQNVLSLSFQVVGQFVTGKVSMDRVNEFLKETEILEKKSQEQGSDLIGFYNASFSWSRSGYPSSDQFHLKVPGELVLKPGTFNVILGPTASGKTSLLMALLGEMKFSILTLDGWYNLPRHQGVAYAAQESWILNMTIRENIIFGSVYDEERYNKVVMQCCLEDDLAEFPAGDNTEVGEKGVTLSGGQKARITLARAVYSQSRIILLDDVLAALDVRTTKWIVDKCFKGDIVKGRTVLLITHNLNVIQPVADTFIIISKEGDVRLTENAEFNNEVSDTSETFTVYHPNTLESETAGSQLKDELKAANGKLVMQEEVTMGHVKWETARMYLSALCGRYSLLVIPTFIVGLLLNEVLVTAQLWFLGQWGNAYDTVPADRVPATWYLTVYGTLSLASVILSFIYPIHNELIHSILHSTLRWLDMTPTSQILVRGTQDIGTIDDAIPSYLKWLFDMIALMLVKLGMIVFITPIFLVPGLLVAMVGAWISNFYIASQLSINRESSKTKAPILDHFVTLSTGIVSIRAYGIQALVNEELRSRVDRQTRAYLVLENLTRWITIRITFISAAFTSSLAAYLVFSPSYNHSLSDIGVSLNMASIFTGTILYVVRVYNELEVKCKNLERVHEYTHISQETKPSRKGVPPAYWPASGGLRVSNLSASYEDGPFVLRDLSFNIRSGEHIGIVGRTGSGKSSLVLSLLRAIHTRGSIYYDGIEVGALNLDVLRSKISVIPQTPQLFTGTLRENLDPFSEYDDAHLHSALESSGFFTFSELPGCQKLALDTMIHSGGSALSVGQRQILALARAMVRGSKVLILDEADHQTDSIIHSSLHHLQGDITILTIAHRLHTIADADRILVLDSGRLVEFDTPQALMRHENGTFKKMVIDSGEQDRLEDLMKTARK